MSDREAVLPDVEGRTNNESRDLSIVIPAFNEAKRIERTLTVTAEYLEQKSITYEIIVVDDGSTDATTDVAVKWSTNHSLTRGVLRALRYESNRGKGYAVRYGILRASGINVLYMDADLATPIEEIEKLTAALGGDSSEFDVAIGSRPLPKSELLVRQPWYRELAGRGFNSVVQLAAIPGVQDTQCGFKLLKSGAAREIFSRCTLDGFSFDVEMLFVAGRLGYKIAEVPVRWAHQEGAAAFSSPLAYFRHGVRMVADLTRIRWSHRSIQPARRGHVSVSRPQSR